MESNSYVWYGGILALNGCIYCFFSYVCCVMKIDCVMCMCMFIGDDFGDKWYKFGGGCVGFDGDLVYAFSSDYKAVLKIDTRID